MGAIVGSSGAVRAVSDAEIIAAYRLLAEREGVFCEPASAAAVAGMLRYGVDEARRVVCVLTGHGLKDPQVALDHAGAVVPCEADIDQVERAVMD
jgi:threonine synthase